MSLEITLGVRGLESYQTTSDETAQRLVKLLQDLDGVQRAEYDSETHRFVVSYDPKRATILRILRAIELLGQQVGQSYRPTDVQTSDANIFPWREVCGANRTSHADTPP